MTVMTSRIIGGCAWCRFLAEGDTHPLTIDHEDNEPDTRSPVIDAEKSNEALKMVAQIRERNGTRY